MYSVVVHTSDSTADYGTNISTTDKLKAFLCALNMQLVTHLEVNYYRELKDAEIPIVTGVMHVVEPNGVNTSTDWEPDNMGLPL